MMDDLEMDEENEDVEVDFGAMLQQMKAGLNKAGTLSDGDASSLAAMIMGKTQPNKKLDDRIKAAKKAKAETVTAQVVNDDAVPLGQFVNYPSTPILTGGGVPVPDPTAPTSPFDPSTIYVTSPSARYVPSTPAVKTTAKGTGNTLTINDAKYPLTDEERKLLASGVFEAIDKATSDAILRVGTGDMPTKITVNLPSGPYEVDLTTGDLNRLPTTHPLGENDMSKKATKEIESIAIVNDSVVPGLNAMLSAATGGKIVDFETIREQINSSASVIKTLDNSLTLTRQKLDKALTAGIPKTGVDITNADELTYELVYVQANEVFNEKTASGAIKKAKELDFPIPTLIWKDKAGVIVQHPEVPSADENYQLVQTNLVKFLTAFSKGMNTWLYGHTGTGKSTFVEQVASRIGFPVSRVNLDSNMERADLVGHIGLREEKGTTVSAFEEGVLPRAMQRPGFLLLDEIDAGRPDILFVIQRALEGTGLMLTEEHGRVVKPHQLFRFCATANTRGQGDEYGIYQGTRNLNTSMVDRFPVFIEFKYLDKITEMKLMKANHPDLDDKVNEQFVVFANEVRSAFSNGEVFQPITPRGLDRLAELYLHFQGNQREPMKMALEMTVYDKTTKDTIQKVKELADRCLKAA